MKTTGNTNEEKSIKTTITQELSNAIGAISKRSKRNESDIFRNAIEFFLKKNYPEFLEKPRLEILNQVKEKYQFDKILEEYRKDRYFIENIPIWQNILKESHATVTKCEEQIDDIKRKLLGFEFGKKEKKQPLKTELKYLQEKIGNAKQREQQYKQTLELAERGETMGV